MVGAERLARWGVPEDTVVLGLPVQQPDVAVPVIELFLE